MEDAFSQWSVAWICSFIYFLLLGVARLSGLLYLAAIGRYNADRSRASLPFVLCYTVRNVTGPLIGYLGRRVEIRFLIASGCFLSALGAGACFFAEDITTVSVLWGGVFGFGFGLGTILLPEVLNQHFDKYISNANGIALGGECVAGFVLPVFVEFVLESYGASGTFLILSGLILHGVPAALLLKPPSKTSHELTRISQPISESDGGQYSALPEKGCGYDNISGTHVVKSNHRSVQEAPHESTIISQPDRSKDDGHYSALPEKGCGCDNRSGTHAVKSSHRSLQEASHESIRISQPGHDRDDGPYSALPGNGGGSANRSNRSGTHEVKSRHRSVHDNRTNYQVDCLNNGNLEELDQSDFITDPLVQSRHVSASLTKACESSRTLYHHNKHHYHGYLTDESTRISQSERDSGGEQYSTLPEKGCGCDNISGTQVVKSRCSSVQGTESIESSGHNLLEESPNHNYSYSSVIPSYSIPNSGSVPRPESSNHSTESSGHNLLEESSNHNHSFSSVLQHKHSITNFGSVPCLESSNKSTESSSPFCVFLDPAFILILFTQSSMIFIFTTIMTIIVDFSRDAGVLAHQEVYILMCLSIADMLGRFGLGWVTDAQYMSNVSFSALCYAGSGLLMVALVFLRGFAMVMVVAFFIGLFLGGLLIVCPGIVLDNIEKEEVTMALASRFVLYAPMSMSQSLLIGFFREKLGSYDGLFYVLAVHCSICSAFSLLVPLAARYRDRRKEAIRL